MALPIIMLRGLKMRMIEKIGLAAIFALILVDVAFTILRVVFTLLLTYHRNVLWATLDPIVAVLVRTLPCYRNLIFFNRAKPIVRTPNVSIGSSKLASIFGSPFSSTKETRQGTKA